ncbi:MAG: hypothetical protein Pyrs2KO_20400 [Pyruvatibacter sp.]
MANLATISRTDLEAMGRKEFLLSLQSMSPEAIKRFKSMRKLPDEHTQTLESYLVTVTRPEVRSGVAKKQAPRKPAKRSAPSKPPKKAKTKAAADDNYVPFPDRFKAWWNGTELPQDKDAAIHTKQHAPTSATKAEAAEDVSATAQAAEDVPAAAPNVDSEWLEKIRARIWGEDFALPGGDGVIMNMAKAVDLKAGDHAADILPGCLGPGRALAEAFETPITCFFPPSDIERYAAEEKPDFNMSVLDPEDPDFGIRVFDKLFCREVLCFLPRRENFLAKAAAGLRGGGNFVFNDVVMMNDAEDCAAVKTWRAAEPEKPIMNTMAEYTQQLTAARLETKSTANVSKSYVALVEADWRRLMESLETDPLPPEGVDALMEEGRRWQARIAALKTGQIAIVRFVTSLRTIRSLSGPA